MVGWWRCLVKPVDVPFQRLWVDQYTRWGIGLSLRSLKALLPFFVVFVLVLILVFVYVKFTIVFILRVAVLITIVDLVPRPPLFLFFLLLAQALLRSRVTLDRTR